MLIPNHKARRANNPVKLTAAEDFCDHKTTFIKKNTENTTPGDTRAVRIVVIFQLIDCERHTHTYRGLFIRRLFLTGRLASEDHKTGGTCTAAAP